MDTTVIAFGKALGSDLYARIQSVVNLDLELQFEVRVILGRAQERVWAVLRRGTVDRVAVDSVDSPSVFLLPTVEVFTLEEGFPAIARGDLCGRVFISHHHILLVRILGPERVGSTREPSRREAKSESKAALDLDHGEGLSKLRAYGLCGKGVHWTGEGG